jgi:uncharacterized protein (TIGR02246 family)
MTTKLKFISLCLFALSSSSAVGSDDKAPDKFNEPVAKLFTAMSAAYNARDSRAFVEQFAPRAEFVDADGNVFEGRDAIAREFTALFEVNPRNEAAIVADAIREVSPGVLSVDGRATFSAAERSDAAKVTFSAVAVRQGDGRWLLASVRSEGERSLRAPRARLKELEWLIGDWVDESDESTMYMSTRWSDDVSFIVSRFSIQVAGRNVMSGTQRIGWDGSLEKYRSWVFDSEGGHASGIWSRLDDRWIVKSTGVSSEGDSCSATHTYERKGPDAFFFSVTDRIVGDATPPDFTSHVVRKPPAPAAGSKAADAPRGKSSSG